MRKYLYNNEWFGHPTYQNDFKTGYTDAESGIPTNPPADSGESFKAYHTGYAAGYSDANTQEIEYKGVNFVFSPKDMSTTIGKYDWWVELGWRKRNGEIEWYGAVEDGTSLEMKVNVFMMRYNETKELINSASDAPTFDFNNFYAMLNCNKT